jgi:hypothetical protein
MTRKARIAITLVTLIACCARAGAQDVASAARERLLQDIKDSLTRVGPDQTLKVYFDCSHGEGYSLVESGEPRGVAVAVKLLGFSDGCYTESLASALATGMQANPEAVLPFMQAAQHDRVAVQSFCIPFIGEGTTQADALTVLDRSERALLSVHRPDLRAARESCLDAIRRYRQAVDRAEQARKKSR